MSRVTDDPSSNADALGVIPVLIVTLEIARDIIAGHTDDFTGRGAIVALLDSVIWFGRSNAPHSTDNKHLEYNTFTDDNLGQHIDDRRRSHR